MRAHERNDFDEASISNELFWGVVAIVLVIICSLIGWFGVSV